MDIGDVIIWGVVVALALAAIHFLYLSCALTGVAHTTDARIRTSTDPVRTMRRLLAVACLVTTGFAVQLLWGALPTLRGAESLSYVSLVAAVLIACMAGASWSQWSRVQTTLDTLDGSCRATKRLAKKADTWLGHVTIDDLNLTPRQQEVVELICRGIVSDAAISEALVISPHTAGTHVRNILRKSGMSSRRDLMLLGLAEPHMTEMSEVS